MVGLIRGGRFLHQHGERGTLGDDCAGLDGERKAVKAAPVNPIADLSGVIGRDHGRDGNFVQSRYGYCRALVCLSIEMENAAALLRLRCCSLADRDFQLADGLGFDHVATNTPARVEAHKAIRCLREWIAKQC